MFACGPGLGLSVSPFQARRDETAPPVYLHSAFLLYEALKGSGELTPALDLPELPSLGSDIYALVVERITGQVANWRELLPPEIVDQI